MLRRNRTIWAFLILTLHLQQVKADGGLSFDLFQEDFNDISPTNFLRKMRNLVSKKNLKPHLGQMCFDSSDCVGISRSGVVCNQVHRCQCDQYYLQAKSNKCLPGVLLGFSCEESKQCSLKVPNSVCVQGFCSCEAGYTQYGRANCLKGSQLGSTCRSDMQCKMVTKDSECGWIIKRVLGLCRCQPGMPGKGHECTTPGYALGAPCGKSLECSRNVPGSICVEPTKEILEYEGPIGLKVNGVSSRQRLSSLPGLNRVPLEGDFFPPKALPQYGGICLCRKGHLAIEDNTKCVPVQKDASEPSASLGKPCRTDAQCRNSDPFSACQNQICVCAAKTPKCSHLNTGCFNGTFQCISDGKCVSGDYVCNRRLDCKDGSDEAECVPGRCSPLAFTCLDGTCLSRDKVCDAHLDCKDGSDEFNCFSDCPASTFRCQDGQCLPGHSFCNAHYDCIDKSDENQVPCIQGALHVPNCPFRCRNQRCRSRSILCSGIDGCGDGSDEESCSVCNCPRPDD